MTRQSKRRRPRKLLKLDKENRRLRTKLLRPLATLPRRR